MKTFALLFLVSCLAVGCAHGPDRLVTADILFRTTTGTATNEFRLRQPKDTTLDHAEFDPATGRVVLDKYTSTANAAALEAAREQYRVMGALLGETVQTVRSLAETTAKVAGVPVPARPGPTPTAAPVVVVTNTPSPGGK